MILVLIPLDIVLDRHDSSADTIEKQLLEDFQVIIAVCHENYKTDNRS